MAALERSSSADSAFLTPPTARKPVEIRNSDTSLRVVDSVDLGLGAIDTAGQAMQVNESSVRIGSRRVLRTLPKDMKPATWEAIEQSWEGRVIYNDSNAKEFTAIISDLTNRDNPDEEVVIGYESVLDSDVEIITEGAVFFWNIGRFRQFKAGKLGPSKHRFEIRFRRLPPISPERLAEIRSFSRELSARLHGH